MRCSLLALNTRNSAQRWVAIVVTQIQEEHSKEAVLLWSLRDITLRKQMQQELQLAYDQLEQRVKERTAELSAIIVQLQQKIDEQQRTQQQIKEQAALVDIATDAIFVQDLDHTILFWSSGAERLYGFSASEAVGQKADALFYREPEVHPEADFNQTIAQGFWQAEVAQVTRTGKSVIVVSR